LHHRRCYTEYKSKGEKTMPELDAHTGEVEDTDVDVDVIDDDEFANPDQEDIGDFEPGDDVDDSDLDAEIDDLPEVGPLDPDEEPVLDELDEEEGDNG
jgi:hypothetical protein